MDELKPVSCEFCQKIFPQFIHCMQHVMNDHKDEGPAKLEMVKKKLWAHQHLLNQNNTTVQEMEVEETNAPTLLLKREHEERDPNGNPSPKKPKQSPWENPDFWDQPNNFACPCGRRFDEGLRYLLHMVNSYHDRTITPRQYANMVRAYSDNEIRNAPADDLRSIAESRQPRKTKEARVSGWIATGDTELKVRRDPEASTYSSRRPRATRNVKGKLVTIDEDRRTETEETTPSVSEPPRNDNLRAQITVEASTTTSSRRRPVPQKIQQPATTTRPKDDERVEEAARASMLPLRRRIILRFIGPRRDVVQHVSSSDNRGTVAQGTASMSTASTSSTKRRDDESDSTGLPAPKEPSDE